MEIFDYIRQLKIVKEEIRERKVKNILTVLASCIIHREDISYIA